MNVVICQCKSHRRCNYDIIVDAKCTSKMDILSLSEQERRWYWELFRLLDVDGSDQLPGAQTFDMFLSSGLQPEIVNQVHYKRHC